MRRNDARTRFPARPILGRLLAVLLVWTCGAAWAQQAVEPSAAEPERPAASGPRIEIAQREIDLGRLFRGESAEGRFEIRNLGDQTLRILRAKPG